MPSYTIHLAVAMQYLALRPEEEPERFLYGAIAPDLLEKPASHYGPYSSAPGLERYRREVGLGGSYERGYYLHLLTDQLFYNGFLKEFSKELYRDYDKMNRRLIERYRIAVPPEAASAMAFLEGEPTLFTPEALYEFIDYAAEKMLGDVKIV